MKNLTKSFKNKNVLDEITMDIFDDNKIISITGENGVGKTTLLKLIAGIITPDIGEITLENVTNKNREKYLQHISSFFGNDTLYDNISGKQNLKLLTYRSNSFNYIQYFGIQDILNKKVKTYSLGQKQKLSLCITMINATDVVILDEPTNGLDKDSLTKLQKLIRERNYRYIITSHNSSFLQNISDRIYHLDKNLTPVNTIEKLIKVTFEDIQEEEINFAGVHSILEDIYSTDNNCTYTILIRKNKKDA